MDRSRQRLETLRSRGPGEGLTVGSRSRRWRGEKGQRDTEKVEPTGLGQCGSEGLRSVQNGSGGLGDTRGGEG
jgi:hypothetical protein